MTSATDDISLEVFEVNGFRFSSFSGKIGDKDEYNSMEQSLNLGNIPLPEMTYPKNFLEITHLDTEMVLRFDPLSALSSWHSNQLQNFGVNITNTESDTEEKVIDVTCYDWLYKNTYDGDISMPGGNLVHSTPSLERNPEQDSVSLSLLPVEKLETNVKLPESLLTRRDEFLHFQCIQLYSSDLNDKGTCDCSVKLRVMPSFFYVLLRTFVRVDRDRLWMREVRYFCPFKDLVTDDLPDGFPSQSNFPTFLKDVQLRECPFSVFAPPATFGSYPHTSTKPLESVEQSSFSDIDSLNSKLPSFLSPLPTSPSKISTTTISVTSDAPPPLHKSDDRQVSSSPSENKREIPDVVLSSMRARASKLGLTVLDDGTHLDSEGKPLNSPPSYATPQGSDYVTTRYSASDLFGNLNIPIGQSCSVLSNHISNSPSNLAFPAAHLGKSGVLSQYFQVKSNNSASNFKMDISGDDLYKSRSADVHLVYTITPTFVRL